MYFIGQSEMEKKTIKITTHKMKRNGTTKHNKSHCNVALTCNSM